MNNIEFVAKIKDIADNYKTSYMLGCWGFLTNSSNIMYSVGRTDVKNAPYKVGAESMKGTGFMFDCVCLIKSVLWGFTGDMSKPRGGGATYSSNGVPDIGADQMIRVCSDVSTDFKGIIAGEVVWMSGHIGVYVGDGKVVECTPRWSVAPDGVKYTNLANLGYTTGRSRTWTKHGKLPYIEYVKETVKDEVENMSKEEIETIVREMGKNEPASAWAADSIAKAKELGLSDGSNPLAYTTREQTMAIAVRAVEYILGKNDQQK